MFFNIGHVFSHESVSEVIAEFDTYDLTYIHFTWRIEGYCCNQRKEPSSSAQSLLAKKWEEDGPI